MADKFFKDEKEILLEEAASAFRPKNAKGEIQTLPAWADLDEEGRKEAFLRAKELRLLEAALDENGLSNTAKAVLERIQKAIEEEE